MAKQITTFIFNQPGSLARFCTLMKEHDIDLRAMNVGDAEDFGIVRIIADDADKAIKVLKENDFIVQVRDVLVIEVSDHPGALVELLTILGKANVNVDYTYALFSRHEGTAGFVLKTDNRREAEKALSEAGIKVLSDEAL